MVGFRLSKISGEPDTRRRVSPVRRRVFGNLPQKCDIGAGYLAYAIAWFRDKKTASKKPVTDLLRAECFLKVMSAQVATVRIIHWKNDEWGEIPADFGRK